MAIKQITVNSKNKKKKLFDYSSAPNIYYYEWQSNDGASKMFYDTDMTAIYRRTWTLARFLGYGPKSIGINRGYTTPAHNDKIPGAAQNSLHVKKGSAGDNVFKDKNGPISSKKMACIAQICDVPGIEVINRNTGAIHYDTRYGRPVKKWWAEKTGNTYNTLSDFFKYFGISRYKLKLKRKSPLRKKNKKKSDVITYVPKGTKLEILSFRCSGKKGWFLVKYQGKSGWLWWGNVKRV